MSYDLGRGALATKVGGGYANCYSIIDAEDIFIVSGGDPGLPVSMTVEFYVHVESLGLNVARAHLQADDEAPEEWTTVLDGPKWEVTEVDTTVLAAVVVEVGAPLRLRYGISGSAGDSQVTIQATLAFSGLPAGTAITSCHGFVQEYTQVEAATWGRIKATYR